MTRFAGYAAIFDHPDRGGDIVRKGAFARAAKAGLPLLWQHDRGRRIGFVERVEEDAGKCWLVVAPATGAWSGKEDAVAVWTGSGWRFLDPVPGMSVWSVQDSSELRYSAGQWIPPVTIIAPTGGAVVDAEARIALNALLGHLANIGLVAN